MKTERDIILLKTFLQPKGESRNVEDILPANLNEFLSKFILKPGPHYDISISINVSITSLMS